MCFSLKCWDFSELCKFCCSTGVWPAIVYTYWHRGETERGQSPEYILKSSKKTIFNEHPVSRRLIFFIYIIHTIQASKVYQIFCLPFHASVPRVPNRSSKHNALAMMKVEKVKILWLSYLKMRKGQRSLFCFWRRFRSLFSSLVCGSFSSFSSVESLTT